MAILAAIRDILRKQNILMEHRNEMLLESVEQQRKSFESHEKHQAASLEALEGPKAMDELKQQFAQALELWSCAAGKHIPLKFQQLQELLPDPIWDDGPGKPKRFRKAGASERVCEEVLAERQRQVTQEKWTPAHDDNVHNEGQLAMAAACYAVAPHDIVWPDLTPVWPWPASYDKRGKHGERRCLVIAAALLVAEIERLDRKNAP